MCAWDSLHRETGFTPHSPKNAVPLPTGPRPARLQPQILTADTEPTLDNDQNAIIHSSRSSLVTTGQIQLGRWRGATASIRRRQGTPHPVLPVLGTGAARALGLQIISAKETQIGTALVGKKLVLLLEPPAGISHQGRPTGSTLYHLCL